MENILEIDDLHVKFSLAERDVLAVRGVSLSVKKGETIGLVGESGCGKSVTAFSILRLINPPGKIVSGSIIYKGDDILKMDGPSIRAIRGKEIAMIFQEPMTSLNPVLTIGYQIMESIILHLSMNKKEAREYAADLLAQVGIPDPSARLNSYPHEFSGGMRQRVMIAIALSASPSILIADEPTTALDVTIQAQILDLLMKIQEARGMSLILITHDLGVVANMADTIAIMYAGEIMEQGETSLVYRNPLHPYTRGLFDAIPKINEERAMLNTIPGTVPTLSAEPEGCVYHPRCPIGAEECLEKKIPFIQPGEGRQVRCIRAGAQIS